MVLINEDAPGRVDHLLARIRTEVEKRNRAAGRNHNLSVSIGIARHAPNARLDIEKLLAEADKSMYDAKRQAEPGAVRHDSAESVGSVVNAAAPAKGTPNPDLALMLLAL